MKPTFNFDIFQHDGHKLQACGGSTGHVIKTVAMCDRAEIANYLLTTVEAYDKHRALIETLVKALKGTDEWIARWSPEEEWQQTTTAISEALDAAKSEGF